jgi:negative regulator of flagellin synthesis FlgM
MRIEGNPAAQPLPESGRSANSSVARGDARTSATSSTTSSATSSASGNLGEDQAELSGAHGQVRELAGQALQFPEIRQEKVTALRQVFLSGNYQPSSKQIADAMFAHMQAMPAA